MSAYPLSTGEAVQHVLEGRECESEGHFSWKMSLHGDTPCIFGQHTTQGVRSAHVALRWRLVPVLVKREEALKALKSGKTIKRSDLVLSPASPPRAFLSQSESPAWAWPKVEPVVDAMCDDTACWEILP